MGGGGRSGQVEGREDESEDARQDGGDQDSDLFLVGFRFDNLINSC